MKNATLPGWTAPQIARKEQLASMFRGLAGAGIRGAWFQTNPDRRSKVRV